GIESWALLLICIGLVTMVLGAVLAILSTDLKAILAYSTVSQLGLFIGYYGFSAPLGIQFDFFHVASHVLFKGCLFMVVGIIDHCTGTRDIRQLGGLLKRVP